MSISASLGRQRKPVLPFQRQVQTEAGLNRLQNRYSREQIALECVQELNDAAAAVHLGKEQGRDPRNR